MPIFKAAENKRGGGKGGFKTSPKPTLDYITRPDKTAIVTSVVPNLGNRFSHKIDDADTPKEYRNLIIS